MKLSLQPTCLSVLLPELFLEVDFVCRCHCITDMIVQSYAEFGMKCLKNKWDITHFSECCVGSLLQYSYIRWSQIWLKRVQHNSQLVDLDINLRRVWPLFGRWSGCQLDTLRQHSDSVIQMYEWKVEASVWNSQSWYGNCLWEQGCLSTSNLNVCIHIAYTVQ